MNALGIYFGPKTINITETKGKKLINNIQIPLFEVLGSGLEEKVPFEVKAVALLNDAFRMNKIEVKEANLCLSGKDLIIRTFEMPLMPKEELQSAISFEAKKYIPFKLEDLITDYQIEIDNLSHTNIVLFVGIKEETFNLYVSIFKQLNIKVNQIEYSGFSILRALKLGQANESGVTGLLCFDLESEDEINFMVLENGFPLFTRDINLTAGTEGLEKPEKLDSGAALEKLKSEVRVSMDYFHRKFPGKAIQKITVISGDEQRSSLETFMSELAISCKFLNIVKAKFGREKG
ncbi:MAG: pilus assembly protein PilM [Candidatus Omnitrophica bacterium]|nr:pilus assembly protein PilM [Candidatus Omnitrophota bacterium]